MKSTFNVISDGSSLLDEHRNDAWLIDSESEWLKCKKGCFKMRPPNSSLEVQHTVSAAVILPVISECPHTVILQNWASWVSGGAYRLTRTDAPKYWRGTRRGAHPRCRQQPGLVARVHDAKASGAPSQTSAKTPAHCGSPDFSRPQGAAGSKRGRLAGCERLCTRDIRVGALCAGRGAAASHLPGLPGGNQSSTATALAPSPAGSTRGGPRTAGVGPSHTRARWLGPARRQQRVVTTLTARLKHNTGIFRIA